MKTLFLTPAGRYRIKLYFGATTGLFFIALFALIPPGIEVGANAVLVALAATMALALILIVIANLYYDSIRYEIHEDEIIVHSGILTKSTKHVPFRTITNLEVKRDLIDQILGIGSLSVQTAGSSSSSGAPEEKLVGMVDVQQLYERVATRLRQFRGGMSPTQAEDEFAQKALPGTDDQKVLLAILRELREIREVMAQRTV